MRNVALIMRRELRGYFATPLAYIFIVIFLALAGSLTFFVGGLLQRGQADLQPFFTFHPWLYLFLVPALSMRLWAEDPQRQKPQPQRQKPQQQKQKPQEQKEAVT